MACLSGRPPWAGAEDVSGLGTPVEDMVLLGDQRAAGGCRLRN